MTQVPVDSLDVAVERLAKRLHSYRLECWDILSARERDFISPSALDGKEWENIRHEWQKIYRHLARRILEDT